MCGRYELVTDPARLKARFDLSGDLFFTERHEFAPTTVAPIIRFVDGERRMSLARWGLIPGWWKQPKAPESTFNARAESVAEKPMFRTAFKKHRCLVPASAFFEWQAVAGEKRKRKYRIALADGESLALAGLWESGRDPLTAEEIESFTVITCPPNEAMEPIHNRMPVIFTPEDFVLWLAPNQHPEALKQLLKPCPSENLKIEAAG